MRVNAEAVRIARIGLVLEMEDGSKVMFYADQLGRAQATVTTETPAGTDPWSGRRRLIGPPETSITITGIEAHRIQWTDAETRVSPAGRALETFRREVRP